MNASFRYPAITDFELRFVSRFDADRVLAFPCDACGHVDLDSLDERNRTNYFYARTCVGREFASRVQPVNQEVYRG